MTTFLSNRAIYTSVICGIVPETQERLWIATADIKDMYVDAGGRDMVPFLAVLDRMRKRRVEIRLIHAKEPGPNWSEQKEEHRVLPEGRAEAGEDATAAAGRGGSRRSCSPFPALGCS